MKSLFIAVILMSVSMATLHCEDDTNLVIIKKCEKIIKYGPLNSPFEPSIENAVVGLGMLGDERGVDIICDLLENHPNDSLRYQCARVLGWMNSKKAIPALEKALKDKYRFTKMAAQKSLKDITGKEYEIVITQEELDQEKAIREKVLKQIIEKK